MQFGEPIRVHVLFFTDNIRRHPFKVIRLTVFLFPLKDASVEVGYLFSLESQLKESHRHRFVEEDSARFFPCRLHAEALETVFCATPMVRVQPHIRGFVTCEAKTVLPLVLSAHHSSPALRRANAQAISLRHSLQHNSKSLSSSTSCHSSHSRHSVPSVICPMFIPPSIHLAKQSVLSNRSQNAMNNS